MRRRHLVGPMLGACLVLQVAAAAGEPGKVARAKFEFGDQAVTYFLYQPKTAVGPAPAPLLVLFHGSNRDGRLMVDQWKKLADREGIVLAAPNAQDPRAWTVPADGPALVCALVAELRKTLPVDPRRTYLFGHSAGAVFTLDLSMLESEYFAAAAFYAGAWRTEREREIVTYGTRRIPIAGIVGDEDPFFPLPDVQATMFLLKQRGFPTDLEVIAGQAHAYLPISSRVNESAWAALKKHALESNAKYTSYQTTK